MPTSKPLAEGEHLFTSESVTEGHPDKVADQISDGVLDAILAEDPGGRVACETLVNTGMAVVSGEITTETCIVCPGDDFLTLFPERIAAYGVTKCKLHMLRTAPAPWRLPSPVMSDLSLARYPGFGALPEAEALRARLRAEQSDALDNGIHLIVVQSADGSLVVGDSHHYGSAPEPFAQEVVDALILRHLRETLRLEQATVSARWVGTYPSSPAADCLIDAPDPATRLVVVTSGTGASTAFGIAEEVFAGW